MKSNLFLRVIILFWGFFAAVSVNAEEISAIEAKKWADENGRLLIETFREPDISTRYQKLDELFLKFVDMDYVSKFVVGKYWRQMSVEQQNIYRSIFKRYALATYKSFPLDFVNSLTYTVGDAIPESNFITVSATVNVTVNPEAGAQNFLLQFRLHRNNGQIQLVDIKLTESSLILSLRSKFYQQIAALEDEIEWFLEDFEMQTAGLEDANKNKLRIDME